MNGQSHIFVHNDIDYLCIMKVLSNTRENQRFKPLDSLYRVRNFSHLFIYNSNRIVSLAHTENCIYHI